MPFPYVDIVASLTAFRITLLIVAIGRCDATALAREASDRLPVRMTLAWPGETGADGAAAVP